MEFHGRVSDKTPGENFRLHPWMVFWNNLGSGSFSNGNFELISERKPSKLPEKTFWKNFWKFLEESWKETAGGISEQILWEISVGILGEFPKGTPWTYSETLPRRVSKGTLEDIFGDILGGTSERFPGDFFLLRPGKHFMKNPCKNF